MSIMYGIITSHEHIINFSNQRTAMKNHLLIINMTTPGKDKNINPINLIIDVLESNIIFVLPVRPGKFPKRKITN